jgi:hypothetical protein
MILFVFGAGPVGHCWLRRLGQRGLHRGWTPLTHLTAWIRHHHRRRGTLVRPRRRRQVL